MSGYREQVRRLSLTAHSPDRSVSAEFAKSSGLRVRIDERRYARHTDESLSEQLTAVVRGAARGAQRAREQLREELWGARAPKAVQRRKPSRDEPVVWAHSPRDLVRVKLSGDDGVDIRVRPGTVGPRGVDAATLTGDVNAALSTAFRRYADRRTELRSKALPA